MNNTLTIQQAADATNLSAHTLRYYERIGLLPPIARDGKGQRQYTVTDLAWIRFVTMLRETGMSIAQMRAFVAHGYSEQDAIALRCDLLAHHRNLVEAQLHRWHQHLAALDRKLSYYQQLAEQNLVAHAGQAEQPLGETGDEGE
jgi:DNA-binding transcriptional MerR regulator